MEFREVERVQSVSRLVAFIGTGLIVPVAGIATELELDIYTISLSGGG